MYNFLKNIRLSRLKVDEGDNYESTQKQNVILSQLSVMVIVVAVIHFIDDILLTHDGSGNMFWLGVVESLMIFVSLFTYIINELRYHRVAKHVFLFSFNFLLFLLNTVAPKESGSYFFFFPLMAATFIFYGYSDERKRYFYLILTAALFIMLTVFDFNIFGIMVEMDVEYDFFTNLISSLVLMALTVSFLITLNKRAESNLIKNQDAMHELMTDLNDKNIHLEKVNNELDSFVYSVSHDLRAPLMSILGLVNLSKNEKSVEQHQSYLSMMEEMVNKLDNFIHEVIDYTRNIKSEVVNRQFDIAKVINEIIEDLKFSEGWDRINFQVEVDLKSPLLADAPRLSTILNNLITNSIKYHNPECENPFIKINVYSEDDKTRLIISDNGLGIDEKYHKQVFEMFFRGTELSSGSGLGLYIVKEMVNKIDGVLEFESVPGKGTRFSITF
ncbi:MAG: HAMP domain-containing sensor histidine kinase [Bacteroidota bacterium]